MSKVWVFLGAILMVALVVFGTTYKEVKKDYLRIHIRANSNLEVDQIVKYEIKDAVTAALTPLVVGCDSFEDVESVIGENLQLVNSVANEVLNKNGFSYSANSRLASEEFPTRSYDGYVLEEGIYDALIVELGRAEGDNWWCVIYPPLCFTGGGTGSNVVYKSRIVDMINNFFN